MSNLTPVAPMEPRTENDAVIEFARAQSDVVIVRQADPSNETGDGVFAAVPKGKELVSVKKFIDEYRGAPERRTGTAQILTEQSFIDHVNRFAGEDTLLFADRKPSLTAVYDYNPAGPNQRNAGFGQYCAVYPFPISDEWKAWRDKDTKPMAPADFAVFIEDRLLDIVAIDNDAEGDEDLRSFAAVVGGSFASPTKLLELSRSLEINAAVGVKQAARLESGEINIAFTEVHNDGEGKPIRVPSLFVIGIPIFVDGVRYRIVCRLRYRVVSGGGITWWYTMVKPQQYLDDAVKESVAHVAEATSRLVLFGTPET